MINVLAIMSFEAPPGAAPSKDDLSVVAQQVCLVLDITVSTELPHKTSG